MISDNFSHFTSGPLTIEEAFKIISLLQNPTEAEYIRKALRLYTVPKRLLDPRNYHWGETSNVATILLHFMNPQNEWELEKMLEHVKGKTSILEIGSNFGGTLRRMAAVMPRGSHIVSVDLDCDDTPKFLNAQHCLKETCRQIGLLGGNVDLIMGDSHSKAVVQRVKDMGPYDFVFIDGDHSYEGVKADWENYGPMGKIVGFHDIAMEVAPHDTDRLGCQRFWQELKASTPYRTEEYISGENPIFGIGVVFRTEPREFGEE